MTPVLKAFCASDYTRERISSSIARGDGQRFLAFLCRRLNVWSLWDNRKWDVVTLRKAERAIHSLCGPKTHLKGLYASGMFQGRIEPVSRVECCWSARARSPGACPFHDLFHDKTLGRTSLYSYPKSALDSQSVCANTQQPDCQIDPMELLMHHDQDRMPHVQPTIRIRAARLYE